MRFTSKVVENIAAEVGRLSNESLGLEYISAPGDTVTYVMKDDGQRVYSFERSDEQAAAYLLGILESYETNGVELSEFSRNARLTLSHNPHEDVIAALSAGLAVGDRHLGITREVDPGTIMCALGTSAHGPDIPATVRIRLEWLGNDGGRTHEIDVCNICAKSKGREFGDTDQVDAGRVTVLKTYGKP